MARKLVHITGICPAKNWTTTDGLTMPTFINHTEISHTTFLPNVVMRYFCNLLFGLLGMVSSIQLLFSAGVI